MNDERRRMNLGTMKDERRRANEKNSAGKIPSWLLERAIEDFRLNLKKFRELYPVKTICMHGSPLSKYDNRLLWEKYDYRDFGIIGEPYFGLDFGEVLYLTDTGRRWDGEDFSVRDKVGSRQKSVSSMQYEESQKSDVRSQRTERLRDEEIKGLSDLGTKRPWEDGKVGRMEGWKEKMTMNEKLGMRFRGTQDIIDAAEAGLLPDKIMITVHPQRWGDSFLPWARELVWQNVKNAGKYFVIKIRR